MSGENQISVEFLEETLRDLYTAEVANARAQHRNKTPECLTPPQLDRYFVAEWQRKKS
jgi:hypothetical protein